MAVQPESASSLGELVDQLASQVDPSAYEWLTSTSVPLGQDPFARMFTSELGTSLASYIGNESQTLSIICSIAAIAMAEMEQEVARLPQLDGMDGRALIAHGASGYSSAVVVLDEMRPRGLPAEIISVLPALELANWQNALNGVAANLVYDSELRQRVTSLGRNGLRELVAIARPNMILMSAPTMVPLCVPTPPLEAVFGEKVSTAGALVRDKDGVLGITAAYHGTGPSGTKVKIGAHEMTVRADCELLDTVFVPLPDGINLPDLRGRCGILYQRVPWDREPHSFVGVTSGEVRTKVVSFDKGLPQTRPGRQLCVQTDPDTNEGDSGCALVNADDELVGFAFQRTAYGEDPQFTDWIWARSVFEAMELTPADLEGAQ